MKNIYLIIILLNTVFFINSLEFSFKFDESYRIESTVYQNVLYNKKIQLSSIILNKYSVNVIELVDNGAKLDVSHYVFQDSKGITQGFYKNFEIEKGDIYQFNNGVMQPITDEFFPSVQNVPFFPEKDIKVGESWTSIAVEHFNLKNGFNINDVISSQFRVFYTYTGNTVIDNRQIAIIDLNYNIYEKIQPYLDWGDFYPVKISGSSKQRMYWDIEKGRPYKLEDNFVLDFYTSTGDLYTFKGNTESRSWPRNDLNSKNVQALVDKLKATPQTQVSEDDKALKITFNSLLFDPESSKLKESVKIYLDSIGKVLAEMDDVNIRILGHTALFGEIDEEYLSNLSTNRAKSVAEYLLSKNYIDKNGIELLGLGGKYPVDSNETSEGRSLNRRVEIEILKN